MEGRLTPISALLAIMILGWIVGWAIPSRKSDVALVAFALTTLFVNRYFAYLEHRGMILEDERTLRINEIASRRTLQVTMVTLAVVMLLLSGKTFNPELRGAFKTIGLVLLGMGLTHLVLRCYYARVM